MKNVVTMNDQSPGGYIKELDVTMEAELDGVAPTGSVT